jgi:ATP-binding cassette subfamily C (CFTR/MRP) protein 10
VSADVNKVDDGIPSAINYFSTGFMSLLGIFAIIIYSIPWFAISLVPFSMFYYYLLNYYRFTAIQVKRFGRIAQTALYANFNETLCGLTTIRAFRQVRGFLKKNENLLEAYIKCEYASCVAANWLALRLQLIGVIIIGLVAFVGVVQSYSKSIDASLFGLILTYALASTSFLNSLIDSFTEVEKEMVSVERIIELQNGDSEDCDKGLTVGENWPSSPDIRFVNVVLKYDTKSTALNSISFEIKSGEKIAIVGRTGSGKSSVLMALFRGAELTSGSIFVDNVDTQTINLNVLRDRMGIMPQDPFLFNDTLRVNLDPFAKSEDSKIWKFLSYCHMADKIKQMPSGLETIIDDKDFSSGEKQLVCLTRTLLTDKKILCFDEPSASVDYETDLLVQKLIKGHSSDKGCTIITIAHRLDTIMDYDKAMVMENGEVAEFGAIKDLVQNAQSKFCLLLKSERE